MTPTETKIWIENFLFSGMRVRDMTHDPDLAALKEAIAEEKRKATEVDPNYPDYAFVPEPTLNGGMRNVIDETAEDGKRRAFVTRTNLDMSNVWEVGLPDLGFANPLAVEVVVAEIARGRSVRLMTEAHSEHKKIILQQLREAGVPVGLVTIEFRDGKLVKPSIFRKLQLKFASHLLKNLRKAA